MRRKTQEVRESGHPAATLHGFTVACYTQDQLRRPKPLARRLSRLVVRNEMQAGPLRSYGTLRTFVGLTPT